MATRISILAMIRQQDPDFDKAKQKDIAYEFSRGHNFYTGPESGSAGYDTNPPDED